MVFLESQRRHSWRWCGLRARSGTVEESPGGRDGCLEILGAPSVATDPGEEALDDPPPRAPTRPIPAGTRFVYPRSTRLMRERLRSRFTKGTGRAITSFGPLAADLLAARGGSAGRPRRNP